MKEFQPPQRLHDLHTALAYCSLIDKHSDGKHKIFTPGERIAINQERGSVFSQIAFETGEITALEVRNYKVSAVIENKVQFIVTKNQNNPL